MVKKSGPGQRVVICCYCDARSLLPATGAARLVCHGCGAPIRVIQRFEPSHLGRAKPRDAKPDPVRPALEPDAHPKKDYANKRRKKKKRKDSLLHRIGDVLDDVADLDDLFDIFD